MVIKASEESLEPLLAGNISMTICGKYCRFKHMTIDCICSWICFSSPQSYLCFGCLLLQCMSKYTQQRRHTTLTILLCRVQKIHTRQLLCTIRICTCISKQLWIHVEGLDGKEQKKSVSYTGIRDEGKSECRKSRELEEVNDGFALVGFQEKPNFWYVILWEHLVSADACLTHSFSSFVHVIYQLLITAITPSTE